MGILQLEIPLDHLTNFGSTVNGTAQITNPLIWIWILRISNLMNPFSKRIHQIKNPDLDLPKGKRNPFLDLKSVFGFNERNTPYKSCLACQHFTSKLLIGHLPREYNNGKGMLSSVDQAFVGREEIRAPLKMPAWEARIY